MPFLAAESEGCSMISLILATVIAQGQAQQLNQEKPKDDPQKKPDVNVIVVPRTIPAGSEIRFVVRDGAVYMVLGASGAEIAVPGGGASGCLGDRVKASAITDQSPEKEKEKEKEKVQEKEGAKEKKP